MGLQSVIQFNDFRLHLCNCIGAKNVSKDVEFNWRYKELLSILNLVENEWK